MINPTEQPLSAYTQIRNVLPPGEFFTVEQGKEFSTLEIAYETYGELNEKRDNAILLLHALSGDAHVKSHGPDDLMGWWEYFVGPGAAIDTDRFFVICSNVIGGCRGSLGPASIDPQTGKPYGLKFPVITIQDMVRAQRLLVNSLGIEKLYAVVGGSMGGMQALEWSLTFPDLVEKVVPIATTARLSSQSMAFDVVGRHAIMSDPLFNDGNYYDSKDTRISGLSLARMIAHITYLSEDSMNYKFGRKLQKSDRLKFNFDTEFQVESYLHYQGQKFVSRFDANSYLYITKAMSYFDLHSRANDDLAKVFANARSQFFIVTYLSDWLFPPEQGREIVNAIRNNGLHVSYVNIPMMFGHDSFLLDEEYLPQVVKEFLYEGRDDI